MNLNCLNVRYLLSEVKSNTISLDTTRKFAKHQMIKPPFNFKKTFTQHHVCIA
jgi:hypothetical protein